MTIPPYEDSRSESLPPTDPTKLPPGFYFPPGTGPSAPPPRKSGMKWLIAVVAVVVAVAIATGIALVVICDDSSTAMPASRANGVSHSRPVAAITADLAARF